MTTVKEGTQSSSPLCMPTGVREGEGLSLIDCLQQSFRFSMACCIRRQCVNVLLPLAHAGRHDYLHVISQLGDLVLSLGCRQGRLFDCLNQSFCFCFSIVRCSWVDWDSLSGSCLLGCLHQSFSFSICMAAILTRCHLGLHMGKKTKRLVKTFKEATREALGSGKDISVFPLVWKPSEGWWPSWVSTG